MSVPFITNARSRIELENLSGRGIMNKPDHKYLVITGPVEVRREILDAQTKWMIGHRSTDFANLFARLQDKLKQVFLTQNRVLISGSSGTGLWEGASRN